MQSQRTGNRLDRRGKSSRRTALIVLIVLAVGLIGAAVYWCCGIRGPEKPDVSAEGAADMTIETPYATLHYPKEWEDQVYTVCSRGDEAYTVVFVGKIGSREAELFSVAFGTAESMPIGTLTLENGDTVAVHLDLDLLKTDEDWSDAELSLADAMIRASGYTTEVLAQQDNFQ